MSGSGFKIPKRKQNSAPLTNKSFGAFELFNKELFPYRLSNKSKEIFYIELNSMLGAGMDLKDSLDVIISQQEKEKDRELFLKLRNDLINGFSLHECLHRRDVFTAFEFYCVQIGEESGRLIDVLQQLADFYTKRIKLQQQIIKSLSYPLVIFVSSILAVLFMLTFIVPMFTDIFKRFGTDLPFMTQLFIDFSKGLREYSILIVLFFASLLSVLMYVWNKHGFKRKRQYLFSKIPYLGQLINGIYLSRFCSSMSLLISAKVPLVQSISLVKKMVNYYPISESLEKIEISLLRGNSLHESMEGFELFDQKMIALVKVGEEVNRLDVFFSKLNQWYSDEVDLKANTLNTFLEPLIIGVLGVIIGLMLVAMYLPMFKLSTSIG